MPHMQLITIKSKRALSRKKMKAIPSCSDKSPAVQSLTETPKDKSDNRGAPRKSILYRVFSGALGMLSRDFSPVEDELQFELEQENLQVGTVVHFLP
jgi:hypothetical protein